MEPQESADKGCACGKVKPLEPVTDSKRQVGEAVQGVTTRQEEAVQEEATQQQEAETQRQDVAEQHSTKTVAGNQDTCKMTRSTCLVLALGGCPTFPCSPSPPGCEEGDAKSRGLLPTPPKTAHRWRKPAAVGGKAA